MLSRNISLYACCENKNTTKLTKTFDRSWNERKKKSYSTTTTTTKNLKFSYSQTICYYCDGKDE